MKPNGISLAFIFIFLIITIQSCEKDSNEKESKISHFNEVKSHNESRNCMECHIEGGSGEGWFSVAGTVYNRQLTIPLKNVIVILSSGPEGTGEVIERIEGDGKGNFFTTETVLFGEGLYVSVEGSAAIKYMQSPIMNGECNACHSNTTSKIWTE